MIGWNGQEIKENQVKVSMYADVFNRMNNEAIKMFEKYTCAIKYVEKTT